MPLIKDGQTIHDTWVHLGDDEPLPSEGDVIVPFERLPQFHNEIGNREGRTGVALPNTADPRELADMLPKLDLVALSFPSFTDGRAYSQAWLLRNELGFAGDLRATGNVLADQAAFMRRCGFTTFETDGRQSIEVWRKATESVKLAYQRGTHREDATTREQIGGLRERSAASAAALASLLTLGTAHFG